MNEIKTFNPVNERYETMNGMWMKWTWMNSEWKWREHKGAERTGTECNEGTVSESVSESWIEFHSRKRARVERYSETVSEMSVNEIIQSIQLTELKGVELI